MNLDDTQTVKGVVQEIMLELCQLNGLGESPFTNRAGCEALLWQCGFVWRRKVTIPDLLDELKVKMKEGYSIYGGVYLQSYQPTDGNVCGVYEDERVAVVDNNFGKGKTRLIGTLYATAESG